MNCVVYANPGHINGCLFDAFEYYVALAAHAPAKLFIISETDYLSSLKHTIYFEDILSIFKDKYNVYGSIYDNIIDVKNRKHMVHYSLKYHITKALIVDQFTPVVVSSYLYAKKYYILVEVYLETKTDYFMLNKRNNVELFSEYLLYEKEFYDD